VKLLYRPFGLVVGVIGGRIATSIFRQLWERTAGEPEAPKPKDHDRSWREVVLAAALQGVVFGTTKAVIDRAGALGYELLTGVWPGRERTKSKRVSRAGR
jgi:uncharacterized iron-regulated membrane protein